MFAFCSICSRAGIAALRLSVLPPALVGPGRGEGAGVLFLLWCSVSPFRMASTESTMTASMPSATWSYLKIPSACQKFSLCKVELKSCSYLHVLRVIVQGAV